MANALDIAIGHLQAEQPERAEAALRAYLQRSPRDADGLRLMGVALGRQGKVDQAKYHFERAISLATAGGAAGSAVGMVHLNFGNMYFGASRPRDALPHLRRAAELAPQSFEAWNSLCGVAAAVGEFDEAISAGERAVAIAPEHPQAHFNLGACLTASGDAAAGIRAIEHAARLDARDPNILTTLLMVSNYDPGRDAAARAREHREIGARLGGLFGAAKTDWPESAGVRGGSGGRRLRVGYLSYDLRRHVVAVFVRALVEHRDRGATTGIEVFAYHTGPIDEVSRELQPMFDHWVHAERLNDVQLVERIRRDGIDVLVDLSGHTDGSRPGVLAMRGARVQLTYMGYPNTTGLPTVDGRIVDAITDPVGRADEWATERLLRVPRCFLAYSPPTDAPAVAQRGGAEASAARDSGDGGGTSVVFGSFNAAPKINPPLLRLWARIVLAVPGSRLLIKNRGVACSRTRSLWSGVLAAEGLSGERVELRGWEASPVHHLAAYHGVDIALDSYPYHGTTTTCESLWMGVPVVTLAGAAHVSRVGASLLHAVGLDDLVAQSEAEYVGKAVELARDAARRATLRETLRERLRASELGDGAGLARAMEAVYRAMAAGRER